MPLEDFTYKTEEVEMSHEKCKGTWSSTLKPKKPSPKPSESDGSIDIFESGGSLKGSHADSDDFPVTCDGTDISFTRVGKSKKKRIEYTGSFVSNNRIEGTYARTDVALAADAGEESPRELLLPDSGDWEATKVTFLEAEEQETKS